MSSSKDIMAVILEYYYPCIKQEILQRLGLLLTPFSHSWNKQIRIQFIRKTYFVSL